MCAYAQLEVAIVSINPTHPRRIPILAPDARLHDEEPIGVIFLLDALQFRIVRPKERRLEVRLAHICFVRVRSAVRFIRHFHKNWHKLVCHLFFDGFDLSGSKRIGPSKSSDHLPERMDKLAK